MFEALANLLVYQGLGLERASHLGAAVHFFVMDVTKIFALLVIIIYIMGLFRALLSPERVREFVHARPWACPLETAPDPPPNDECRTG